MVKESLNFHGYTVMQVKASERSHNSHYLYLREFTSSHPSVEWPEKRTLIVCNVPPYCKEDNLRLLFKDCGAIVRMYLQPKPTSTPMKINPLDSKLRFEKGVQVGYVVFRKPNSVQKVCETKYDKIRYLSTKEVPLHTGLRGYVEEYKNIPDVSEIEKKAEEYMAKYYARKDEEEEQEKQMEGVPDEDGFIKVTRHGKNKGGKRTEETDKKGKEHLKQRKKKNELQDFYTFQFRETQRKHIADLQAKFEEDKKKVREMKAARKFRPY